MTFTGRDALISLDGWSLVLTCGQCGVTRSRPARDLFLHCRPGTEIHEVLPNLRCRICGVKPVRLEADCVWVRSFGNSLPRVDLTELTEQPLSSLPLSEAAE